MYECSYRKIWEGISPLILIRPSTYSTVLRFLILISLTFKSCAPLTTNNESLGHTVVNSAHTHTCMHTHKSTQNNYKLARSQLILWKRHSHIGCVQCSVTHGDTTSPAFSKGRHQECEPFGCCHRIALEAPFQEGSMSLATDKITSNHVISTVALIGQHLTHHKSSRQYL